MIVGMQQRRGLASEWTSVNPTLRNGEIGFETDTDAIKFGDGITPWNTLPYFVGSLANLSTLLSAKIRGQRKVSLLGASVTYSNGNSTIVVNPGPAGTSGPRSHGPVTWANMILGYPMQIVGSATQGGLNSAQILANVPTALAPNPNYVIGHDWWINDIVQGVSLALQKTNITAIINQCNAAGATVILTDFPTVAAESTVAMKVQHAEMVAWLDSIQGPGFLFLPICDDAIDITTGTWLSWATYDGTHLTPRGAQTLGLRLADYLKRFFPNSANQPRGTNTYLGGSLIGGSQYELMGNPMITGTVTNGVAVNFTLGGTAVPVGDVVAAEDFTNLKWQRVQLTADGYANLTPALVTGAGLTYGSTTIVPGTTKTRMQFEFRMPSVSASGKWACVNAWHYYAPASNTVYALQETSNVGQEHGLLPDDNAIYLARSQDAIVPSGTTSLAANITVYGQAGAVMDFRRVSVAIQPY